MFDINDELDAILKKHDLLNIVYLKDRLENAIRSIVSEYTEKYGRRIIVRGLKPEDENYPILEILSDYGDIVAVEDKNPFADMIHLGNGKCIEMFDSEHAPQIEFDLYIINSLFSGRNICYDLISSGAKYCIVDLYTEMRVRYGIAAEIPFEQYTDQIDYSHHKTHEAYERFQEERNDLRLDALLSACLVNRDFVTFYEVIKEADDLITGNHKFSALINDIGHLLDEVKSRIADRKENPVQDIVLYWIDQVAFDELVNFPKLQNIISDGLFFEKAYALAPYTKMMGTCLLYRDELQELNTTNVSAIFLKGNITDSKLYNEILNNGYAFFLTGLIKLVCMPSKEKEFIPLMTASSVHYWNMINHIINSDKPVFGIIHSMAETHEPWMAPKCDEANPSFEFFGSYDMSKDKIKTAASYYDNVIDFFTNILTGNTINIYMSDHGKWEDINLRRYEDHALHTVLGITNMGIKGNVSRIFSYKYLFELICWIMKNATPNARKHFFGDMDIRSESFKAGIKNRVFNERNNKTADCTNEETIFSDINSGFLGIKTDSDTYICLNNGREIYYLNSDIEKINRIMEVKYSSRIELLREKINQLQ